jgi:hypothetical protein
MEPQKCIKTDFDMMYFERSSPAYALLLKYVEKMCLIASGKFCQTQVDDGSTNIISSILDDIHTLAESIEPINQPMRFGNKAFRALYDALAAQADSILSQTAHLSPDVIRQFKPYLMDSFGNPVRIDYGTGHEAAFLAFIICLVEGGVIHISPAIPLVYFRKYVATIRYITTKYSMEPAGSHGVWGVDDYHHLPFLFGAAELIGHEKTVGFPREMFDRSESLASTSLFAYCISHIKETKCRHAPFHEVSPILSDLLTRMDNWTLVCYGLMQLYKSDVLAKKPVMQHFYFSKFLRWQ